MTWLRWHVGSVDASNMRAIAREAGTGATPGHCVSVWAALLEHAAQQRPRGSIESFDSAACAASFDWPVDLVRRIVHAMMVIGMHDFTRLQSWDQNDSDPTNARRQKMWRAQRRSNRKLNTVTVTDERNALRVSTDSEAVTVTDERNALRVSTDSEAVTVTDERNALRVSTDSEAVTVTVSPSSRAYAEKALALDLALKAPGSFFAPTALPILNSTVPASASRTRAADPDGKLSTDAVWSALAGIGIKPGMFGRFGSGSSITHWIHRGLTAANLDDAIGRAQRARQRDGDASPIGLRYLACFVEDVLSGQPERGKPMSWIERGDAIGRAWLEGRT